MNIEKLAEEFAISKYDHGSLDWSITKVAFISGMKEFQKQLKTRITELRNADAEFCKDRWNMALPNFQRALAREESNKVTFARQVLEEFILPEPPSQKDMKC